MLFFCKQKTAYEMRISDWSSDVCSSDLDGRMHQRFQPLQFYVVTEHPLAERLPVDAARTGGAGKGGFDPGHKLAARTLQAMHFSVSVEDGHAQSPKHIRDRRLAHADRSGEADDDHCRASL